MKEDIKYIYNKIWEKFSNTRKKHRPEINIIKNYVWNQSKVLDLWCWDWRLVDYLDDDINYIWVDISDKLISIAQEKYPNKNFYVDDMINFLKKQNQQVYDNIIMLASFQHIPTQNERIMILKNIYKSLNYWWRLILVNWCFSWWFIRKYKKQLSKSLIKTILTCWIKSYKDIYIPWKTQEEELHRYYHIFSLKELNKLLKYSWLIIEKSEFTNWNWEFTKKFNNKRNSLVIAKKDILKSNN